MNSDAYRAGRRQELGHDDERVHTGNAEFDAVLGGGFPAHSINLVMGGPGTGKTIFVEQLAFRNIVPDRPILYFSTLAEPLSKLVRYLQGFSFYDPNELGVGIIYDDVGPDLATQGASALVERLREAIRTMSPRIIIIDSVKAVHDLLATARERREFVYELTGLLGAYDTTAFLVGEYNRDDVSTYPEFAIADSVVEFSRQSHYARDERYFRVLKLRGSHYAEGAHAVRIGSDGIRLFPRLVAPESLKYEPVLERVSSGLPGLDEMVGGGFWIGSSTLVAGPSGSGKTTMALQFAREGARKGESVLFLNFQENPTQLARSFRFLGIDSGNAGRSRLHVMYESPVELQIDTIVVELFRRIEELDVRRVIVDALGDLASSATDPQRLHDYLYALIQHLATRNVTNLLTLETAGPITGAQPLGQVAVSYMSDNLILLGMEGEERTRRTLRVLKTRASAHDPRVRELRIDEQGARLL